MKILVTGSSGLIGTEVCRQLRQKNVEIIEFDHQTKNDISNPEQLLQKTKGCDAVIHLAAILDENASENQIWKTNVDGTKNVLEASAQNRVSRILFLSSVGIYGNKPGPKTEETPQNPETNYEKSKAEAERLVISYQELVPFTILRSALVIGPNQYWKQILKVVKSNFPLIGNGHNQWQTIHYKDLANAVVFFLFSDAAENEIFLVAGEDKPTLKELVETVRTQVGLKNPVPTIPLWLGTILAKLLGAWLSIQHKPNILSSQNIQRLLHDRNYDLTKIHAYGWKAKYNYSNSLKETISEIRNQQ